MHPFNFAEVSYFGILNIPRDLLKSDFSSQQNNST